VTDTKDGFTEAEIMEKIKTEAKRVSRKIGADACVIIGIFKNGDSVRFQDAGLFPMPPEHFYHVMKQAHEKNKVPVVSRH